MTDEQLNTRFDALMALVEPLGREIGEVKETLGRINTRLDKIAAGSHYVTRLVEWSEKQDAFQADILARVQRLETSVTRLEGKP